MKIAVVGPESSGKTTLCTVLAGRFAAPIVEEVARAYLNERSGSYGERDLVAIARSQCRAEDRGEKAARRLRPEGPLLICDTDMITIRIWSEEKFGRCDRLIVTASEERHYDHWLLCRPDIPWEEDPLRENPHDRHRLFAIYQGMLTRLGKPFSIIEGDRQRRLQTAVEVIDGVWRPGAGE